MLTTLPVTLFYDEYEKENGDGFYPTLEKCTACTTEIIINFTIYKEHNVWKQMNNFNIDGLDGNDGETLLKQLNKLAGSNCVAIVNKFDKYLER